MQCTQSQKVKLEKGRQIDCRAWQKKVKQIGLKRNLHSLRKVEHPRRICAIWAIEAKNTLKLLQSGRRYKHIVKNRQENTTYLSKAKFQKNRNV